MATRRFRYASFCLTYPEELQAYEALMQQIKVDAPERFEVLSETGGWTQKGERMADVTYIEKEDGGDERY